MGEEESIDPAWVRKREETLLPQHKISMWVCERSSPICKMFKEIEPQPLGPIDVEVARQVAKEKREESDFPIFLTALDTSKPGEPEYSEVVYGWVAEAKCKKDVDDFVEEFKRLEERYKELRSEILDKLVKIEPKEEPSLVERLLNSS